MAAEDFLFGLLGGLVIALALISAFGPSFSDDSTPGLTKDELCQHVMNDSSASYIYREANYCITSEIAQPVLVYDCDWQNRDCTMVKVKTNA